MAAKTQVRNLYRQFKADGGALPELAFYMQDWDDPYNVGGMYRVADAVGARELFSSGTTPRSPHPQIHVTSMGHHRRIKTTHFERHEAAVSAILANGYSLIAIELAEGAVSYTDFEWPKRVCLALGSETRGMYAGVMNQVQGAVFVPQFGKGRSMNVHVSAAIVGFHVRMVGLKR